MAVSKKQKNRLTNRRLYVIASTVAEHFGHTVSTLTGKSRSSSVMRSRRIAYKIADRMEFSAVELAEQFGRGTDHQSVLRALERAEEDLSLVKKLEKQADKNFNEGKYDANYDTAGNAPKL